MRLLIKQNFPIYLVIPGSTDKTLYRLGADLIDAGKLILVGKVDLKSLAFYLSAADIALMPLSNHLANRTRVPMKFGDYIAAGVPIVTNPVGEAGKLVKSKKLGVVSRFSPQSYAKSIIKLLNNAKLRRFYRRNCLNFAQTDYHYLKRVELLEKIYSGVISLK